MHRSEPTTGRAYESAAYVNVQWSVPLPLVPSSLGMKWRRSSWSHWRLKDNSPRGALAGRSSLQESTCGKERRNKGFAPFDSAFVRNTLAASVELCDPS